MAAVALEGVTKVYPTGVRAVAAVSLEVAAGELAVCVGPSGSGKTTLLRLIAGLEAPTAGVLRLDGRVMNHVPPAQRGVALVGQRPALYPHLTVADNLAFGLRLTGSCKEQEVQRRVAEAAELLGLAEVCSNRPGELSGGQQQRVALGRALVRRPRVILLDEPLSNLDGPLRTQLRRELHLLQRRFTTTMIYVTHDQVEALTLADRLIVLRGGLVQQADQAQRVYQQPCNRFVANFLGWPTMNLLEGRLLAENACWKLVEAEHCLRLPEGLDPELKACGGQSLVLGIRAEDVSVPPAAGSAQVSFRGRVTLVEPFGSGKLVTCQLGSWQLTALASPAAEVPGLGAEVEFGFALDRVHWFDLSDGRAVSPERLKASLV